MLKKIDKPLLFTTIFLIVFGIIMIYSASSIWSEYKFNDSFVTNVNFSSVSTTAYALFYEKI